MVRVKGVGVRGQGDKGVEVKGADHDDYRG
jgi:hypothetical protein